MGWGGLVPAKKLRVALLPMLLSLAWPAGNASADTCRLKLLNSVPLTVTDNIASVPASVGAKEKQFQIDTAAPDNQMGKDAVQDFGLAANDFMPAQQTGGAGSLSSGSKIGRDFVGYGSVADMTPGNTTAIYDSRGTMFRSLANAASFTLGAMQTDHMQFVVTDFPAPGSGGILSAKFFQRYDIDLNFSAHRFNMFAPDHCQGQVLYWRAPGMAKLPFHYQNGRIIVQVSVDGRETDAVIDTGSPRSRMQSDDAGSWFKLSFGGVSIENPHLAQTHAPLLRGTDPGPQTGTLLRNNDPTATQPSLVIGTDLLKLLHVYIAFNERMVYVTQGPELPEGDARAMPVVTVTPFRP